MIGAFPALIVLIFLRFREGQLVVFGQELTEFDLPRLTAAVISTMVPLLSLLPLALAFGKRTTHKYLSAFGFPFVLLGPTIVSGWILGAQGMTSPFLVLVLLGLLLISLVLWFETFVHFLGIRMALICYGFLWGCSQFVAYVAEYIAPYFESKALHAVQYLRGFLPQIQNSIGLFDEYLQTGTLVWNRFLPVPAQILIFGLFLWWVNRKNKEA